MTNLEMIMRIRWGSRGEERAEAIMEAFQDVEECAVCNALIDYRGNFPPYPKDIERTVGMYNPDELFSRAVAKSREGQIASQKERVKEWLKSKS